MLAQNSVPSVDITNKINTSLANIRINENQHVLAQTPAQMDRAEELMKQDLDKLKERMARYESYPSSQDEKTVYAQFKTELGEFLQLHDQIIQLSAAGEKERAATLLNEEGRIAYNELDTRGEEVRAFSMNAAKASFEKSAAAFQSAQAVTITLLGLAFVAGIGAIFFAVRGIARPINSTTEVMRKRASSPRDSWMSRSRTRRRRTRSARWPAPSKSSSRTASRCVT
ncbi:MCP four helix bundle domain-containing protein [Rhizobium halophilum]|uniref:MCP four helix bundle domain-containing protein n=1 Tax=Rhizobium halophilum TaxID=2846852 RepID=UPI00374D67DC